MRRAARAPTARFAIYERRSGHVAITLTPTLVVVPPTRHGAESLPWFLVVYSADRGIIVSGYQVTSLDQTSAQFAGYQKLLKLVEKNRPTLERLLAE